MWLLHTAQLRKKKTRKKKKPTSLAGSTNSLSIYYENTPNDLTFRCCLAQVEQKLGLYYYMAIKKIKLKKGVKSVKSKRGNNCVAALKEVAIRITQHTFHFRFDSISLWALPATAPTQPFIWVKFASYLLQEVEKAAALPRLVIAG